MMPLKLAYRLHLGMTIKILVRFTQPAAPIYHLRQSSIRQLIQVVLKCALEDQGGAPTLTQKEALLQLRDGDPPSGNYKAIQYQSENDTPVHGIFVSESSSSVIVSTNFPLQQVLRIVCKLVFAKKSSLAYF